MLLLEPGTGTKHGSGCMVNMGFEFSVEKVEVTGLLEDFIIKAE